MAKAILASGEIFGLDGLLVASDVAVEGEACGSIVKQPENGPAFLVDPVIKSREDLKNLKKPNPMKAARMPVVTEAIRICKKAVGDHIHIASCEMGPMNIAGQLRGIEQLMFDMIDSPDFFEEILDFALAVSIDYGKCHIDAGTDRVMAGEALCSTSMISPDTYRQYIVPRHKLWSKTLKDYGAKYTQLHICGNATPILADIGSTGVDCADIDHQVNMREVKEKGGIVAKGNIDTALLVMGSKEEVLEKSKEVLETAKQGGGLILSSGCDLSPDTPQENLHAMVEASKLYGRY
jgi:MtaA/CmuA family methyltransferase